MPITTPPNQNKFIAPVLAPDLQRQQMQLERNKMMAQQLMKSEAPQGQMVSGHFVAPSWTQQLAHALSQGFGGKVERELPKRQAELQQAQKDHIFGQFGIKPTPQQLAAGLETDSAQGLPVSDSSQPQAGQSPIPGVPGMSREQQAYLAAHIGMEEYLKLAANRGGPINVAPGGSLYNPQTGQVDFTATKDGIAIEGGRAVPVPGYSEAAAAAAGDLTRAQEGAKAGFDLVEVPDGSGGVRMMPRDQAAEVLRGGPANFPGGGIPGSNPPALGTAPSPVSVAADTKLNEDWISGSYRPTLDAAGSAASLKNTITAMRQIPLDTGFGTEFQGAAANLLTSLGVPNADRLATDVQKFQSLAMDRLQTELMKQKGPQTEGDAERAAQTFAKLGNTPEANKFIFDFAEAKSNMDMRKASFYEAALPLAKKAGDLTEIDRRWRKLQGSIWDDPLLIPYKEMQ